MLPSQGETAEGQGLLHDQWPWRGSCPWKCFLQWCNVGWYIVLMVGEKIVDSRACIRCNWHWHRLSSSPLEGHDELLRKIVCQNIIKHEWWFGQVEWRSHEGRDHLAWWRGAVEKRSSQRFSHKLRMKIMYRLNKLFLLASICGTWSCLDAMRAHHGYLGICVLAHVNGK